MVCGVLLVARGSYESIFYTYSTLDFRSSFMLPYGETAWMRGDNDI